MATYPTQAFPQTPPPQARDLAAYVTSSIAAPFQLWTGTPQAMSDSAPAVTTAVQKYQVCALLDTNQVTPFIPGTHTAKQVVIASQPAAIGVQCPYWKSGEFNHEALIWPTGTALDTYIERKALLIGCPVQIGHLI